MKSFSPEIFKDLEKVLLMEFPEESFEVTKISELEKWKPNPDDFPSFRIEHNESEDICFLHTGICDCGALVLLEEYKFEQLEIDPRQMIIDKMKLLGWEVSKDFHDEHDDEENGLVDDIPQTDKDILGDE